MSKRRPRLAQKFKEQKDFAAGYSPLYARFFATLAGWLADPGDERRELVDWLLAASSNRRTLEVTLLLAAGLHRDILAGQASTADLSAYYPTAGGKRLFNDGHFETVLYRAIMAYRQRLAAFMAQTNVQTNETGRGLCWLLPLLATGWPAVHLVDLGASAGLNLVADQRAYRLVTVTDETSLCDLGLAPPVQFVTRCQGETAGLRQYHNSAPPLILSRTGGDQFPFLLETMDDELTLMSFVWGDQVARLQRLREGIAAWHRSQDGPGRANLYSVNLPAELPNFLSERIPESPAAPVVIYNTYMTIYLPDRGSSLPASIGRWAVNQPRPVLWLQWEPPPAGTPVPDLGWCAWTADLWQDGQRFRWRLAWVHPHGTVAEFGNGQAAWQEYWRSKR